MNPNRFAGFSLIEVLVSLLLLSWIMLGFDATELYSLRQIRAAYYFNSAANQLDNMFERLRSKGIQADVQHEVQIWNLENKAVLPQGWGQVKGGFPDYEVTIYWGGCISPCEQNQVGKSGCLIKHITI
jgi:prepilin-type N-terminal cleavage/methylation domain-containing protein